MRNLYSIVNTTACQISTKENEIKGKNLMGKEESFGTKSTDFDMKITFENCTY